MEPFDLADTTWPLAKVLQQWMTACDVESLDAPVVLWTHNRLCRAMQPQSTKFGKDQSANRNLPKTITYASIDMIAENQDSKYIVTQDAYMKK